VFTPVLAQHSKSFSLVDCTSWDRSSGSVEQTSLYFSDLNESPPTRSFRSMGCPPTLVELGTPEISQKVETFGPGQSYEDSVLPRYSGGTVRIRHEYGRVDRTKRSGTTDKQITAGVRSPTDSPLSVQFRYN
jgi:hypothetical protein